MTSNTMYVLVTCTVHSVQYILGSSKRFKNFTIKHQTHVIEDEMSVEAKKIIPGNATENIYSIMQRCALSAADEYKLMQHVKKRGAIFISTPFSRAAANRLQEFGVPAFKVGSGECNNYPLIKNLASFKKPLIISTGMNTIETVRPTVKILRDAKVPFALLHCTNVYPTPPVLVRLGAMTVLKQEFPDAVIGLSDHTTSNYSCLGAVAIGASILERHFTDSMNRSGPDISCSMDPIALKDLIMGSKAIFLARGGSKNSVYEEEATMAFAFASVVSTVDIFPGEKLTEENIWVKRPGGGDFTAANFELLLGKKVNSFIKKDTQLKMEQIRDAEN